MRPEEWHRRICRVIGMMSLQITRHRTGLSDLNSWADELALISKDIRRFAEKFKNAKQGEKNEGRAD